MDGMSPPSNRTGFRRDTTTTAHRPGSRQSNGSRPRAVEHHVRAVLTLFGMMFIERTHFIASFRPDGRFHYVGGTAALPSALGWCTCVLGGVKCRQERRTHDNRWPIDTTHEIQLDGHEGIGTEVLRRLSPQL